MSGVWGWFGGGGTQRRKESPKNAILALRSQLDLLQKRQKHLQSQLDEQHDIARKNVSTNKAVAKKALERRKLYQGHYTQTEGQIVTLEHQIHAIESANINRETLGVMEQAAGAMKQIHGKLTPEKVDETMDKLRDQNAISDEIAQAMNSVSLGVDQLDDTELEAELEELQQEQVDEQMLKLSAVPVPDNARNPIKTPAAEEEPEDEELRQLQAEMAM